ncbi:FAD-binding domain-containing protein [Vulcanococcus sp. Clear-D1]|uniref:FAD-binding domain-containing protein n=1 Tax=Vulcanococcus sp. Clear-D1 TaxID=2766970 RepID=UPI0019A97E14|nr:FAD-binding domain-containing protein [Vulcanococcus sp. Clear-D1]MBD1195472.1 deoxyribodipyrimidine photo-lyase [Vulcanococcus sp. Clear-D1]
MACTVVWFRRDLRLSDHAALSQASRRGAVLPVFVLDRDLLFHPETAVARVAFMLECLRALDAELRQRGGRLLIRSGDPADVLLQLVRASGANGVIAHTDSERLVGRVRDARVSRALAAHRIPLHWVEPAGATGELMNYSHWSRQWHQAMANPALAAPERLVVPAPSEALPDLPVPNLNELGLRPDAKPIPAGGSAAALQRLEQFCEGSASRSYYWELSYPSAKVTTGLSPYLKFGVITPRQCLQRLAWLLPRSGGEGGRRDPRSRSAVQLASRLRWGCAIHQRFRYLPQLELSALWSPLEGGSLAGGSSTGPHAAGLSSDQAAGGLTAEQEELYAAWREGRTGFPIVDTAARCLRAQGGWLELNFRSRAIYASFLSNLCGIDWRFGALHYMRHLIDGDCPIDHYQWAMQAGVTYHGSKAWTRIYHPGQVAVDRCDPQGLFIRRWLPELRGLTNDQLGAPPAMADYPAPVLDYERSRRLRLESLEQQRLRIGDVEAAMARLPRHLHPFGYQRIAGCDVAWADLWASQPPSALQPSAVDLERLDPAGWKALLSWFSGTSRTTGTSHPRGSRSRSRRAQESPGQLSLNLEFALDPESR